MATTVSFSVDSPHGPRPVSIAYERTGPDEPLLLLHGIGHHRQAWDPVLPVLAVGTGCDSRGPSRFRLLLGAARRCSVGPAERGPGARSVLRGARSGPATCGGQCAGRSDGAGAGPREARAIGGGAVARRFLDGERAALCVRDAAGNATGRAVDARAADRTALAQRGRTCGADQHHLRPARPPFTQRRCRGDHRPARGDRFPPDACRRAECHVHR